MPDFARSGKERISILRKMKSSLPARTKSFHDEIGGRTAGEIPLLTERGSFSPFPPAAISGGFIPAGTAGFRPAHAGFRPFRKGTDFVSSRQQKMKSSLPARTKSFHDEIGGRTAGEIPLLTERGSFSLFPPAAISGGFIPAGTAGFRPAHAGFRPFRQGTDFVFSLSCCALRTYHYHRK